MTVDLFSSGQPFNQSFHRIEIPDSDIVLYPELFSQKEADSFLHTLIDDVAWKQEQIKLYGKVHDIPRLTAWYGDPGKTYIYSGIRADSLPWTGALLEIKRRIESVSGGIFNSVLLNFYRKGSDNVSWHSDDEPELGKNPVIGSVSFGQERIFQLKHKHDKLLKQSVLLPHGSLFVMRGSTQANWLHQVPKSSREMKPRINLTFRSVR